MVGHAMMSIILGEVLPTMTRKNSLCNEENAPKLKTAVSSIFWMSDVRTLF